MASRGRLTRQGALKPLLAFVPELPPYGAARNQVPPAHGNVSRFSASIRFRTLREDEVIEIALEHHSFHSVEKWLQEVCWRRYGKGWLAPLGTL
jgi:deoxyribodipyrimidine photo-lyase